MTRKNRGLEERHFKKNRLRFRLSFIFIFSSMVNMALCSPGRIQKFRFERDVDEEEIHSFDNFTQPEGNARNGKGNGDGDGGDSRTNGANKSSHDDLEEVEAGSRQSDDEEWAPNERDGKPRSDLAASTWSADADAAPAPASRPRPQHHTNATNANANANENEKDDDDGEEEVGQWSFEDENEDDDDDDDEYVTSSNTAPAAPIPPPAPAAPAAPATTTTTTTTTPPQPPVTASESAPIKEDSSDEAAADTPSTEAAAIVSPSSPFSEEGARATSVWADSSDHRSSTASTNSQTSASLRLSNAVALTAGAAVLSARLRALSTYA